MKDDEFLELAHEMSEKESTEMTDNDIQPVWRNFSQNKNSSGGFYVWDVVQFVGAEKPAPFSIKDFIECADGTWIMIQCNHFWTEDKAIEALKSNIWAQWQNLIIVEKSIALVYTNDTELDEEEPSDYMIG